MKNIQNTKQGSARIAALCWIGLLLFAGCKDLFHPDEGDNGSNNNSNNGTISNITYSTLSGHSTWTLQSDGRRKSPTIGSYSVTKSRVSFTTSRANASIKIQLDVSSEQGYDFAFISTLDNASATYESGYYSGDRISGTNSVTVTIPVPTAGSHFIDIGYYKNGSGSAGSDCAWFKVVETNNSTTDSSGTTIPNITYSTLSGSSTWTLESEGRRKSPAIGHNGVTATRVRFTTTRANATITIQLDVSSEAGYDIAVIGRLNSDSLSSSFVYYADGVISGTNSVTKTILVPTAGSYFIDIRYKKDATGIAGSDCAWFKVAGSHNGSGNDTVMPANLSLEDTLTWINNNAVGGGNYTITLRNNETIAPQTLSYSGKNVNITLSGGAAERTVSLSSTGSLFTVGSGVKLTLDSNVTLQGISGNTSPLVTVNSGGALVMNADAKVRCNSNTSSYGGGVYVSGTFTMSGGTISGNTASSSYGGGVYVSSGTFTKQSGGTIYGSDASSSLKNTAYSDSYGHAVYVSSGSKKRNITAGTGVTLDSSVSGTSGGWE
ncbi:MAG: hypothetical protein LBQ88_09045 [Treponema sp.]|jgi:hypothetical protein|nr:hypothetical protein [Treponema sp.]